MHSADCFVAQIEKEKAIRKETFLRDASARKLENSLSINITDEYRRRQIFEMLQNIDDQQSTECLIELNKSNRSLTFSNEGDPFSIEGMKSIMTPCNSPKDRNFIGNKGLGFRSLLNWSKNLIITTRELSFHFSKECAQKYFSEATFEYPFMPFPEISPNISPNPRWVTQITLLDLSEEIMMVIEKELKNLLVELLLFLRNLKKIKIRIGEESFCYQAQEWKNIAPGIHSRKLISPDNTSTEWLIYSNTKTIGESRCNVSIAVMTGQETPPHPLYNYFPTECSISLPCLLHATVELGNSRNHLTKDSQNNNFIFKKIIPESFQFFAEYLRDHFANLDLSPWTAYRLLSASSRSDIDLVCDLYIDLRKIRDENKYCPCADGNFQKKADCISYQNTEINLFFNARPWNTFIPNMVKHDHPNDFLPQRFSSQELVSIVNTAVSQMHCSDEQLANLLYVLCKIREEEIQFLPGNTQFSPYWILRDEFGQYITSDCEALTPPSSASTKPVKIPQYFKAKYISKSLCEAIFVRFEEILSRFGQDSVPKRSFCNRYLEQEKKSIVDITFYDNSLIVEKIISQCNMIVNSAETADAEKKTAIHQMLDALYDNYDGGPWQRQKIPLKIKHGKVVYASELLFLEAHEFYGDLLPEDAYFHKEDFEFEFPDEDKDKHRRFLCYLGVKDKVRIEYFKTSDQYCQYFNYLEQLGEDNGGLPERYHSSSALDGEHSFYALKDAEVIKGMSIGTILSLLDGKITEQTTLRGVLLQNECIRWRRRNRYPSSPYYVATSYAAFQLHNIGTPYLLNWHNETLKNLGRQIDETCDFDVLRKLGARDALDDLSVTELYDLLDEVAQKNIIPSKNFYLQIHNTLLRKLENGEIVVPPESLLLYASTSQGGRFIPAKEIFYNDNLSLGNRFGEHCPMLYLRARVGVDNVCKTFGVNKISDADVKIDPNSIQKVSDSLQNEFDCDLATLYPFFLAFRLNGDREVALQQKREIAQQLKKMKIILVKRLHYRLKGDENELPTCGFVPSERAFFFRIPAAESISDLKADIDFCASIAAILCIVLKTSTAENEKSFRNCIYDTKIAKADFRDEDESLRESRELLNTVTEQQEFWHNVTICLNAPKDASDLTDDDMHRLLNQFLPGVNSLGDIKHLECEDVFSRVMQIAEHLGTSLDILLPANCDLYQRHKEKMRQALLLFGKKIRYYLWYTLCEDKTKDKGKQRYFKYYLNAYERISVTNDEIVSLCDKMRRLPVKDYEPLVINFLNEFEWYRCGKEAPELFIDFGISVDFKKRIEPLYPDLFDQAEKELQLFSLLYFPGNREIIEKELDVENKLDTGNSENSSDNEDVPLQLSTVPPQFRKAIEDNKSLKKEHIFNGTGSVSVTQKTRGKRLEEIGDSAEKRVLHWLIKNGKKNVEHISGKSRSADRSDAKHYDIRYEENDEMFFVEVKSCEQKEFFLTAAEYQFAKENEKNYRLALVIDNNVIFLENVFQKLNDGESFNCLPLPHDWHVLFQ